MGQVMFLTSIWKNTVRRKVMKRGKDSSARLGTDILKYDFQ